MLISYYTRGSCDNGRKTCRNKKFINNITAWGGKMAKLTILENTGHNAWEPAFTNPEMWKWLFEQKNTYEPTEKNTTTLRNLDKG